MRTLIKTMLVAFTVIAITVDAEAKPRNKDYRGGRHRHGRPVIVVPQRPVICVPAPVVTVYQPVPRHYHQPRWVPGYWAQDAYGRSVWIKGHYR